MAACQQKAIGIARVRLMPRRKSVLSNSQVSAVKWNGRTGVSSQVSGSLLRYRRLHFVCEQICDHLTSHSQRAEAGAACRGRSGLLVRNLLLATLVYVIGESL